MSFRHDIESLSGQNVNLCFQCSKCSAGCPLADKMDLKPAQVMHSIRLGREESVLNSTAIWLCLGCETCSARCPQQVEPAAAMNAARVIALRKGIKPAVKEIGIYYRGFVDNMRLNGKIHDASVAGIPNCSAAINAAATGVEVWCAGSETASAPAWRWRLPQDV